MNFIEISGEDIKLLRLLHRTDQNELSKALNVCQATVSNWENGRTKIKAENQGKILAYFSECSLSYPMMQGIENVVALLRDGNGPL